MKFLTQLCSVTMAGVFILGTSTISVSAFGNDLFWERGFGQGTAEALITRGPGNSIYVACEAGSGRPSSISFSLAGRRPTGSRLTMTFDDNDPEQIWVSDGVITSNCRACAGNFDYVISGLKQHASVHILFENGDGARFSLDGSSEAIGECTAEFYQ
jgi:hypothetical protein